MKVSEFRRMAADNDIPIPDEVLKKLYEQELRESVSVEAQQIGGALWDAVSGVTHDTSEQIPMGYLEFGKAVMEAAAPKPKQDIRPNITWNTTSANAKAFTDSVEKQAKRHLGKTW